MLSASGQAWQSNERGWQIRAGGSSQLDVIDVQARRRLRRGSDQRIDFSVEQLAQVIREDEFCEGLISLQMAN